MSNDDDIDRLILELHATGGAVRGRAATRRDSSGGCGSSRRAAAATCCWSPERHRRSGSTATSSRSAEGPLDGVDIEDAVLPALPPHARRLYRDTAHRRCVVPRHRRVGRFRINLHRERGRAAAAVRLLPTRVPRLATLGLPPSVEVLAQLPRGLVLIGGPTGSGKTTTLAALVEEINRRDARHIVTIEDPIEYEHLHQRRVIEQVEIGVDAPDFPTALRAAVRQAPDVIVVGEMRDPETMRIALAAAETGHLVLSTLHTTDVASTVSRIADSFPDGAAEHDPAGAGDGAGGGDDPDAPAEDRRRRRPGR